MPGYDLKNVTVLVVEAQPNMRTLVREIFRQLGVVDIKCTDDPALAFAHIQRAAPDIVVTDWSPSVDALLLLDLVRKSEDSPNRFLPVIVLSAFTELRHVQLARDAGMTEFLAKPFSAKLIYSRIKAVIERNRVFVRAPSFFGPDRRRRVDENYRGAERRRRAARRPAGNAASDDRHGAAVMAAQ